MIEEYTYKVNDDNSFTVFYYGEEIHQSRQFRLKVQAERCAQEWVQQAMGQEPIGDITLDVHNMVVDADSLF